MKKKRINIDKLEKKLDVLSNIKYNWTKINAVTFGVGLSSILVGAILLTNIGTGLLASLFAGLGVMFSIVGLGNLLAKKEIMELFRRRINRISYTLENTTYLYKVNMM